MEFPPFIFHICHSNDWNSAIDKGEYKPHSFDIDGFIHCSTCQQLLKVANIYYQNESNLKLIWIDPAKLIAPLKWEENDGDVFPHIYGAINLSAVIEAFDFIPDKDGIFRNIPGCEETPKDKKF